MRTDNRSLCGRRDSVRSLIVTAAVACGLAGCGHPRLSPAEYEVASALQRTVQARNTAALERAIAYLAAARAEGRLAPRACDVFERAITRAQRGEWDRAADDLLRLLRAQNVPE